MTLHARSTKTKVLLPISVDDSVQLIAASTESVEYADAKYVAATPVVFSETASPPVILAPPVACGSGNVREREREEGRGRE